MKRLALASMLISVAAYTACAVDDPTPPDQGSGGTGAAPTGGASPSGGANPMGGATTGGASPTGGATTGGATTGGTGGAPTTGGTGGVGLGGMGVGGEGLGGQGLGGMAMGGQGLGGMAMGGQGLGGMAMGGQGLGGMAMGGQGMGGRAMGGSGGSAGNLMDVAAPLHGHTILMPCGQNTETRVCIPRADTTTPCTNPGGNTMPSYAGTHSHNERITLGGTPGAMYRITLKIRGMVEGKTYTGGTERSNTGTQVPADGLYTGGYANNSANGYNIYFIRTDTPLQHYYLNSIAAGSDTRIRHSVFDVDMTVDITAAGGSTVCLVSADPNTSAIKNCAEPDNASCNPVTLQNLDPLTAADIGTQPYNGQFVGITVQSVTAL